MMTKSREFTFHYNRFLLFKFFQLSNLFSQYLL